MATNNAINCKDSGIVSYNGAGTFSALSNPLTVSNGGFGVSSNTAYAVLTGGTSSTNPVQSIASVGTSGQVLTSNGASALPTFQTLSSSTGYLLEIATSSGNPTDAATYFMRVGGSFTTGTSATISASRIFIPRSGTINVGMWYITISGTLGSTQNVAMYVRLNNTTDTALTTTSTWNSSLVTGTNSSLGISVTAGDFIQIKVVCPTWTTNPTTVRAGFSVLVE